MISYALVTCEGKPNYYHLRWETCYLLPGWFSLQFAQFFLIDFSQH